MNQKLPRPGNRVQMYRRDLQQCWKRGRPTPSAGGSPLRRSLKTSMISLTAKRNAILGSTFYHLDTEEGNWQKLEVFREEPCKKHFFAKYAPAEKESNNIMIDVTFCCDTLGNFFYQLQLDEPVQSFRPDECHSEGQLITCSVCS